MKIKEVYISTKEQNRRFIFEDTINLIHSIENSKGKTTLLRTILYGLGYNIPATDGIETYNDFFISIKFCSNNKEYIIERSRNNIDLYNSEDKISFILPEQIIELHSLIFGIDDEVILNNLLAVFYIDQEKGWTLLNRGIVIGKNRFNIEDFIAALSNKDVVNIKTEIEDLSNEIKKYRSLKSIAEYKKNFIIDDNLSFSNKDNDELYTKQKYLILKKEELTDSINETNSILKENKKLIEYLEKLEIYIKVSEKKHIRLTKDNIVNFQENQMFYVTRKKELEIQLVKIKKELAKMENELSHRNLIYNMKTIADDIDGMLNNVNIDEEKIEKVIGQLTRKKSKLSNELRNILSDKNQYLIEIYDIVKRYAIELGIGEYIKDKTNYILTNKLKGMTGKILTQTVFCFKLAYILEIKKKYNIDLPIIIDSPKTNELSDKATNDMLRILSRDFKKHQIIMASIYQFNDIKMKIIEMHKNLFY